MKLYQVHTGFYDSDICDGLYESHANFFVVAEGFEDARKKAKDLPEFKRKRMHIDGLQEVQKVSGFNISLEPSSDSKETIVVNYKHRELAPKKSTQLSP